MALDPFFDLLDIVLAVLKIVIGTLAVAVEKVDPGWFAGLDLLTPASVLDIGSKVAWEGIGIGSS